MSETEAETTEDAAPSNAELDAKVTALDSKIDVILSKLGSKEGQAHAAAQQHTEDRLDRPTEALSIAEQVRAQLAERDAAASADAEKRSVSERLANAEQRLAGMAEQTPEPPQRRIEKFLGWR